MNGDLLFWEKWGTAAVLGEFLNSWKSWSGTVSTDSLNPHDTRWSLLGWQRTGFVTSCLSYVSHSRSQRSLRFHGMFLVQWCTLPVLVL
jgi:hypothetical protein